MTEQNELLLRFYREVRELHRTGFSALDTVAGNSRTANAPGPVVDAVFILKKSQQYVEGLRNEINRALELLQRLGCLHAMHTEDNALRGEIASGYGSSTMQSLLPDRNKDPASYAEVMKALGAPDLPTIRPSFSGVEEHVTKLMAEGRRLPPALERCKQVPKFTVVARAKSGVDLDALANNAAAEKASELEYDPTDNPF